MSNKRNGDGSPKPSTHARNDARTLDIESPVSNHKRTNSDVNCSVRLLPHCNVPNIDGEDDTVDMSPLKRLQRLKQNGSLRLKLKERSSKRKVNFPTDRQNYSDSDTSLSDKESKCASINSSKSDVSNGNGSRLDGQKNSCVKFADGKEIKDGRSVHFEDDVEGRNENKSNPSERISSKVTHSKGITDSLVTGIKDFNGNKSTKVSLHCKESDSDMDEHIKVVCSTKFRDKTLTVPTPNSSQMVRRVENATEGDDEMSHTRDETNDVDSETGERRLDSTTNGPIQMACTCAEKRKPAIPKKPPNLQRVKGRHTCVQNVTTKISSPQSTENPTPRTVISAKSNGDVKAKNDKKDIQDVVTIEYTLIPKPVIEVKLIQRETKSQTPSPSLKHSTNKKNLFTRSGSESTDQDEKWLSMSVDELDKPVDIYACPTSFLRDRNVKLRHSFIDRGFTDKERETIYNSIGDVQTLLRNSFVCQDEKIYSLPQPACYGDNTLKAVKKITEKYDTLQRRKLRALSFREGAKCFGAGVSFSQPSSPVSPTGFSGVPPPPPPSSPPPPLSAGTSSVDSVFEDPDGLPESVYGTSGPCSPPLPLGRSTPFPFNETTSRPSEISPRDTARLDLFYHGRDTEVIVCQCLADLRFGNTLHGGSEEVSDWSHVTNTGVPLLILNTGKGARRRELLVIIAERETGFPLWSDRINYLSNYRQTGTTTHVFQLSNNLRKVAEISFYCENAAKEFLYRFQEITEDPNDNLWKVSTRGTNNDNIKKKRPFSFRRFKAKKPNKTDISLPCNFSHITSVDPDDRVHYENLRDASQLVTGFSNSPTSSTPVSLVDS